MGIEILEQVPDVDAVLIPVGGAGLIAGYIIHYLNFLFKSFKGVSLAIKMLNPRVTVIGVEPVSCPSKFYFKNLK